MDSHDSSAPPPHPLHHHHHHHQPPPYSSHHAAMLMHNPIQQHPSNNSYLLPNNSTSVVPTTSNSTIMHQQNPRFPFNSVAATAATSAAGTAQKPLDHQFSDGGNAGGWFSAEPARKKRGRPRKYSPDNSIGLGLSPAPAAQISPAGAHVDPGGGGGTPSSETPVKRHRGRPPGSVKKQLDALGIQGVGFTPHVITVNSGEDVASKILAFSQQGPRTVCILSANGAICNVTLRQPATSGGTVTYEGRFEIISLSGSFPTSDSDGNQTGALIVSLAGSDGRVLGGGVAGMLKAASPVQVIVGSFVAEAKKPKNKPSSNPSPNMLKFDTVGNTQASPTSGSGSSDSGDENDDDGPLPPASQPYGNAGIPVPLYSNMGWPNTIKM